MGKFEIEIDDINLYDVLWALRNGGLAGTVGASLADQIQDQSLPSKRGSGIRTEKGIYVLADPDDKALPWLFIPFSKNGKLHEWVKRPSEPIIEMFYPGVE